MHINACDSITQELLRLICECIVVIFIFSIEHPNLALTRTYKQQIFTEGDRCCLCLRELSLFDELVCDGVERLEAGHDPEIFEATFTLNCMVVLFLNFEGCGELSMGQELLTSDQLVSAFIPIDDADHVSETFIFQL